MPVRARYLRARYRWVIYANGYPYKVQIQPGETPQIIYFESIVLAAAFAEDHLIMNNRFCSAEGEYEQTIVFNWRRVLTYSENE